MFFVWTKMQAVAGETLDHIVSRKEAERRAGNGEFWWGIGNSLGTAIGDAAGHAKGNIPVLFSKMLSRPKVTDSSPASVCVWNCWRSHSGQTGVIPAHVLVTGGSDPSVAYYALVCSGDVPLQIGDHGQFDPEQCRTKLEKVPGSSQVTALLRDLSPGLHSKGQYRLGFRATLAPPWAVRLSKGRALSAAERSLLQEFTPGGDWLGLVSTLRRDKPAL